MIRVFCIIILLAFSCEKPEEQEEVKPRDPNNKCGGCGIENSIPELPPLNPTPRN